MTEYAHGFRLREEHCDGCLACMRACPTDAIRVPHGKARVLSELCIDCGSCLKACKRGAITATTRTLEELGTFAFKVAVPTPVLFTQFPAAVRPEHVVQGLLAAGFDAVWDYGVELRMGNLAIADVLASWHGARPLINLTCPVIVRLLQVSYPRMVDQIVQIQPPREVAGRELKRRYSRQLGLPPEQIAAIYVTPCQARTISILQPAEGGRSFLDGAVGIAQLYNPVLAAACEAAERGRTDAGWDPARSAATLRWSTPRALAEVLNPHGYLSVTGLHNVISVFDDIERGKLKNIDFVEPYACWGGCANGNLTVDNVYVSLSKLQQLMKKLPEADDETQAEAERRHALEDYSLERPFAPRDLGHSGDLRERVRRVKETERIFALLPGLDCGLCGTSGCRILAHDVAVGQGAVSDCVFLSKDRLDELRRLHGRRPSNG